MEKLRHLFFATFDLEKSTKNGKFSGERPPLRVDAPCPQPVEGSIPGPGSPPAGGSGGGGGRGGGRGGEEDVARGSAGEEEIKERT